MKCHTEIAEICRVFARLEALKRDYGRCEISLKRADVFFIEIVRRSLSDKSLRLVGYTTHEHIHELWPEWFLPPATDPRAAGRDDLELDCEAVNCSVSKEIGLLKDDEIVLCLPGLEGSVPPEALECNNCLLVHAGYFANMATQSGIFVAVNKLDAVAMANYRACLKLWDCLESDMLEQMDSIYSLESDLKKYTNRTEHFEHNQSQKTINLSQDKELSRLRRDVELLQRTVAYLMDLKKG